MADEGMLSKEELLRALIRAGSLGNGEVRVALESHIDAQAKRIVVLEKAILSAPGRGACGRRLT